MYKKKNHRNSHRFNVNPLYIMAILLTGCGCTYNISMVHTDGTATDVVDTGQKADADVKPQATVSIPMSPL